jgi:hypothetical protein
MDNPEKLIILGTQDTRLGQIKQQQQQQQQNHNTICVGYHNTQTNTNNEKPYHQKLISAPSTDKIIINKLTNVDICKQ